MNEGCEGGLAVAGAGEQPVRVRVREQALERSADVAEDLIGEAPVVAVL